MIIKNVVIPDGMECHGCVFLYQHYCIWHGDQLELKFKGLVEIYKCTPCREESQLESHCFMMGILKEERKKKI
jgi:hypothetical protein